jgi:hypothetical protein
MVDERRQGAGSKRLLRANREAESCGFCVLRLEAGGRTLVESVSNRSRIKKKRVTRDESTTALRAALEKSLA